MILMGNDVLKGSKIICRLPLYREYQSGMILNKRSPAKPGRLKIHGSSYMTFYTAGISRFGTSTTAPIATGRAKVAGRNSHPPKDLNFARRTSELRLLESNFY